MGWPFDSVILSQRQRISVPAVIETMVIHAGVRYFTSFLVFISISLICNSYRNPSLCGDPAEGLQVSRSWPCVEQQWSNIVILNLVHPFATSWHFPSRGNEKFRGTFRLSADRPRMTVEGRRESVVKHCCPTACGGEGGTAGTKGGEPPVAAPSRRPVFSSS